MYNNMAATHCSQLLRRPTIATLKSLIDRYLRQLTLSEVVPQPL